MIHLYKILKLKAYVLTNNIKWAIKRRGYKTLSEQIQDDKKLDRLFRDTYPIFN